MSEVIDILTLAPLDSPSFTVDTTKDYIHLDAVNKRLRNSNGSDTLKSYDPFSILSAGFILPEMFTPWKNAAANLFPLPIVGINIIDDNGALYLIDVIGNNGDPSNGTRIFIPLENYEIALDVFVDVKRLKVTADYGIYSFLDLDISMKNIPAALNGKVLYASPFIKILHNFQMFPEPI